MNVIRALRSSRSLSQEELSQQLNVHQTAIRQWETGKTNPDMNQAIRLADFFGVSVDYILGRSNDNNPPEVASPTTADDIVILARNAGEKVTEEEMRELKNEIARTIDYFIYKKTQEKQDGQK